MILSIKEVSNELINIFDCGNEILNVFFKKYAKQNDKRNLGKTFVLMNEREIIGFYTLSSAQISFEEMGSNISKRLPKYPIPCIRIARLAVSVKYQKKNYGKELLKDSLIKILRVSQNTGVYFVLVDAKEESKYFYEHFGFIKLIEESLTYILPISTIIKAKKSTEKI